MTSPGDALQPWHWRSQPLIGRSGAEIFAKLFRHQPTAVLLESPIQKRSSPISTRIAENSRYSICAGAPRHAPHRPHELRQWTPPVGEIFSCLRSRLEESLKLSSTCPSPPSHLPFIGGWLGWLGYDLAWEIEALPQVNSDPLPFPVAFWYEPESFAVLDHQEQMLWLAASKPQALDHLEAQLESSKDVGTADFGASQCGLPHIMMAQSEFEDMVNAVKSYIQAGDIFQANVSVRFMASGTLQPWDLYQALHAINPSPFASYWQTPWGCVVSCSPERLVKLSDRLAQTRPIAGTRPRGTTSAADRDFAEALRNSPKEQAEHTMLVDLERNDLGRVCEWGTIEVDEFFALETYSHVMHLVSNVVGQLRPDANAVDLIRAVFPGGTITGCPKVRCMEIIEQLEPVRRSLFYGSCGFLDLRGSFDLNILIRTLLITASPNQSSQWYQTSPQPVQIWGQVGAGIVADSHPTQEWQESLQKAQAQWAALRSMTTTSF